MLMACFFSDLLFFVALINSEYLKSSVLCNGFTTVLLWLKSMCQITKKLKAKMKYELIGINERPKNYERARTEVLIEEMKQDYICVRINPIHIY